MPTHTNKPKTTRLVWREDVQTIDRELVRDEIIDLGGRAKLTRTALLVTGINPLQSFWLFLGAKLFKDIK